MDVFPLLLVVLACPLVMGAGMWLMMRALGVDVQDFESDARSFLERYDTNYVSVRDGGSSTYENYGLTGIPETYYLDARGRVVAHAVGEVSPDELEAGIANAVAGS
jgi:cytochrome c biogenesis protein CcmG, thiol:disulfide interchange protein DsbE